MIVDLLNREGGAVFVAGYVVLLMMREVAHQIRPEADRRGLRLANLAAFAMLAIFVLIVIVRFISLS